MAQMHQLDQQILDEARVAANLLYVNLAKETGYSP
jgi:hypothetical protein